MIRPRRAHVQDVFDSVRRRLIFYALPLALATPLATAAETSSVGVSPAIQIQSAHFTTTGRRTLAVDTNCPGSTTLQAVLQDAHGIVIAVADHAQTCATPADTAHFAVGIPGTIQSLKDDVLRISQSGADADHPTFTSLRVPDIPDDQLADHDFDDNTLSLLRQSDANFNRSFSVALGNRDFESVDRLLTWLDRSNVLRSSDLSADEVFHDSILEKLNGTDKASWMQRFAAWQKDHPTSTAARLANIYALDARAWRVRGDAPDAKLSPEARELFQQVLGSLHTEIAEARRSVASSPLLWEAELDVLIEQRRPHAEIEHAFSQALQEYPGHIELYILKADPYSRERPRCGCATSIDPPIDWRNVDTVIRGVHFADDERTRAAYAVIYDQIFDASPVLIHPFRDSLADWRDMHASLDALIAAHPVQRNFNIYAAYACIAQDWHAYAAVRKRIVPEGLDNSEWFADFQPKLCDAMAASF